MARNGPETESLLLSEGQGDELARQRLRVRHRSRPLRMVAVRMDVRLAPRLGPSNESAAARRRLTFRVDDRGPVDSRFASCTR